MCAKIVQGESSEKLNPMVFHVSLPIRLYNPRKDKGKHPVGDFPVYLVCRVPLDRTY